MDISSKTYFELFALEEAFHLDTVALTREYKALQMQYHPDKFVNADDRSKLQALQIATLLNDAYTTLLSPLTRAAYLLKLHSIDPEENNQGHLGGEFLMRQMGLREQLMDISARDALTELDQFKAGIEQEKDDFLKGFSAFYEQGSYDEAKPIYSKLQFIYKLLAEIESVEEKLLDY